MNLEPVLAAGLPAGRRQHDAAIEGILRCIFAVQHTSIDVARGNANALQPNKAAGRNRMGSGAVVGQDAATLHPAFKRHDPCKVLRSTIGKSRNSAFLAEFADGYARETGS